MKKMLYLMIFSLFILTGCNKSVEDKLLKDSYNYKSKVKYNLYTGECTTVKEFLNSLNLYLKFSLSIDYSKEYFEYYDLYFFKYDGLNFIMRDLDDYVCLKDKSDKIDGDDYYNINLFDSIFSVIDKFGLPDETSGSQYYFTYNYNCDEYSTRTNLLFSDLSTHKDTYYINYIHINKNWF